MLLTSTKTAVILICPVKWPLISTDLIDSLWSKCHRLDPYRLPTLAPSAYSVTCGYCRWLVGDWSQPRCLDSRISTPHSSIHSSKRFFRVTDYSHTAEHNMLDYFLLNTEIQASQPHFFNKTIFSNPFMKVDCRFPSVCRCFFWKMTAAIRHIYGWCAKEVGGWCSAAVGMETSLVPVSVWLHVVIVKCWPPTRNRHTSIM